MRRVFHLPQNEVEYLNRIGLSWETVTSQGKNWLLVHGFPLPEGYRHQEASVALFIPPNYPVAQIDMCFFSPAIVRCDGQKIVATQASSVIDGQSWQRWSRHRTAQNPWRPGEDNIGTHLRLVEHWLEREFLQGN